MLLLKHCINRWISPSALKGMALKDQGKAEDAIKALELALGLKGACLGDEHSSLADTYLFLDNELGNRQQNMDCWHKAMQQYEECLVVYKKTAGER